MNDCASESIFFQKASDSLMTFPSTISSRPQYSIALCIRTPGPIGVAFGPRNMAVTCGKSYGDDATAVVMAEVGFEVEDMAYMGQTRPSIHDFVQGWTMHSMPQGSLLFISYT